MSIKNTQRALAFEVGVPAIVDSQSSGSVDRCDGRTSAAPSWCDRTGNSLPAVLDFEGCDRLSWRPAPYDEMAESAPGIDPGTRVQRF